MTVSILPSSLIPPLNTGWVTFIQLNPGQELIKGKQGSHSVGVRSSLRYFSCLRWSWAPRLMPFRFRRLQSYQPSRNPKCNDLTCTKLIKILLRARKVTPTAGRLHHWKMMSMKLVDKSTQVPNIYLHSYRVRFSLIECLQFLRVLLATGHRLSSQKMSFQARKKWRKTSTKG